MGIKNQNKHNDKEIKYLIIKNKKLINGVDSALTRDDKEEYLNITKIINQTIPKLIPK